ncbi:hypothetical protein GTP46_00505 [Duganella sp. FT135W]|uniref:DUF6701 domain-containing protein n=1 Tax=Duganella flavida TaxID=2692175 RepID=A0A6L8K4P2_9BURK|nr:DUF6701 domain-containing protein [Duganella flavida]MYM21128.1 hypothetical protein [Duganella flavida]
MTSNCIKFVWLIVLTMLMGSASAANINFDGSSIPACPLSGSTYNCAAGIAMGATDFVVISSGYTVVTSAFSPSYNQGLTINSGGALQSSGSIDLSNINPGNVSTGGSTLKAAGSFTLGSSTTINGSVVAGSISTNSGDTITGNVTVSGLADLGSGIKINGSVTANAVKTNSPGTIGGAITSATTVAMGSSLTVGGNVSGTTITSTSPVYITGNVNATTSFTLASGSTVTGNITSPTVTLSPSNSTVTGNISASNSLDVGSGVTITGSVTGGSLTLRASNAVINGSATMTGDVDMGSGTSINGDLSAHNVTMHSSSAAINGNASVNAIYIDWGDSVSKTITCTGPSASGCSCVTTADPNYHPTCGAAPAGMPHHFKINHSGSALTCQPQTVTVTACANAACTAPNFTSNIDVTLQPGGQTFTVSGGVNSAATVQSKTAGTYTLSATASGVTNATTCVNSGSGAACDMVFTDTGLTVTATNHVSLTPGVLVTVQALTASSGQPSCVPLIANKTVNVDMACSYQNPTSGTLTVGIGSKNAACGPNAFGATVPVPLTFDASGKATAALSYADVGMVGISASYATSSLGAVGNGTFYAAPARFRVTATNAANTITLDSNAQNAMPNTVFAKASEAFTLAVTAVNYNGTATPNFGKETTASKVKVTPTVNKGNDSPIAAPVPSGTGSSGALTYAFPAFTSGASSASANFDDVGYTKLVVSLDDGTATPLPYYLGQTLASFQTSGTLYVARFVPDHFDTVLVANTGSTPANLATMACPSPTSSIYPCSGNTTFTHSKQNFFVNVLAYNGAATPALTANYAGSLAKAITLQAMTAKGGSTVDSKGAFSWSQEGPPVPSPAPARYTFTSGTGTLDMTGVSTANLPAYVFTSTYLATSPGPLPVTIYLRANDVDGVSSLRTSAGNSVEAPLTVVNGRLLVTNAYGSPTSSLPVPVSAQYFLSSGYVSNPLAQATSAGKISSYITFSNCQKALAGYCGTLKLYDTNSLLTITNGTGKFTLAAPTPTISGIGSADVILKNSTTDLIPFLPSTTGRVTFGVYRSGPVIYTREIY